MSGRTPKKGSKKHPKHGGACRHDRSRGGSRVGADGFDAQGPPQIEMKRRYKKPPPIDADAFVEPAGLVMVAAPSAPPLEKFESFADQPNPFMVQQSTPVDDDEKHRTERRCQEALNRHVKNQQEQQQQPSTTPRPAVNNVYSSCSWGNADCFWCWYLPCNGSHNCCYSQQGGSFSGCCINETSCTTYNSNNCCGTHHCCNLTEGCKCCTDNCCNECCGCQGCGDCKCDCCQGCGDCDCCQGCGDCNCGDCKCDCCQGCGDCNCGDCNCGGCGDCGGCGGCGDCGGCAC